MGWVGLRCGVSNNGRGVTRERPLTRAEGGVQVKIQQRVPVSALGYRVLPTNPPAAAASTRVKQLAVDVPAWAACTDEHCAQKCASQSTAALGGVCPVEDVHTTTG